MLSRMDNSSFRVNPEELSNRQQELLVKNLDMNDPCVIQAMKRVGLIASDLHLKPRDQFAKVHGVALSKEI
jgi:hypothetical protein